MDVDFDLEDSDRITDFLHSKLEEIKSQNLELESSLKYRQEVAQEHFQVILKSLEDVPIKIGNNWKRIINGKYVLGFEIIILNKRSVKSFSFILNWTSSLAVNYKVYLDLRTFNSQDSLNFTPGTEQDNISTIVTTFDIPSFTDQLCYTVSGYINLLYENQKITVKFPLSVEIKVQDITDDSVIVQLKKVVDASHNDFLALIYSCERYDFIMITGENSRQRIENILEKECGLTRINIQTNKKLFLLQKNHPILDGALMEIRQAEQDQGFLFTTFCKNLDVTMALLHYLHGHIAGVVIIPKHLYQPDLDLTELTDILKNSLNAEIDSLMCSKEDFKDLKGKIADIEYKSDVLISRINAKHVV